jgi:CRISPR-associated protein Cas2
MTVVVTRNVSDRVRGFLASSMLELAPGVYSAPRMNPATRSRVWGVLSEWFPAEAGASVVMVWPDSQMPGGQNVQVLGIPPVELVEVDGLILSRRSSPTSDQSASDQSGAL